MKSLHQPHALALYPNGETCHHFPQDPMAALVGMNPDVIVDSGVEIHTAQLCRTHHKVQVPTVSWHRFLLLHDLNVNPLFGQHKQMIAHLDAIQMRRNTPWTKSHAS